MYSARVLTFPSCLWHPTPHSAPSPPPPPSTPAPVSSFSPRRTERPIEAPGPIHVLSVPRLLLFAHPVDLVARHLGVLRGFERREAHQPADLGCFWVGVGCCGELGGLGGLGGLGCGGGWGVGHGRVLVAVYGGFRGGGRFARACGRRRLLCWVWGVGPGSPVVRISVVV